MYYTYLIRCSDGSLYCGIATDLSRRMAEHRSGACPHSKYTRTHPPVAFCAAWESEDRSSASRLEYRIKRLKKYQKESLAQGEGLRSVFSEDLDTDTYRPLSFEEWNV